MEDNLNGSNKQMEKDNDRKSLLVDPDGKVIAKNMSNDGNDGACTCPTNNLMNSNNDNRLKLEPTTSFSLSLGNITEFCSEDNNPYINNNYNNNNMSRSSDDLSCITDKISFQGVGCDVCFYKKFNQVASSHCSVCSLNFCTICSINHDSHKLFRNHCIVPVSSAPSVMKCDQHKTEQIRYYCTNCLVPMCAICAVTDHLQHSSTEIGSALGNKKEVVENSLVKIMEKVGKQEEVLARLEDIESVVEVACKKLKNEIENHTDKLITQLLNQKLELLDSVDQNHLSSLKLLNSEKEICSKSLADTKGLWKFAAKLVEPGQSVQLLAIYPDLMNMVDDVTKAPEPVISKEVTSMQMFIPRESFQIGDLRKCEMSIDLVRRISGIQSPLRPSSPLCDQNSTRFFHENEVQSLSGAGIRYLQNAQLLWQISKIGSKVGEINEVYDLALSSDGTVFAAEWLNQRIQVFDPNTGCSKAIIGQGQIQPWGITMTRDGQIVVTDEKNRTVKIFNHDGSLVSSWKKNLFGWPRGVSVGRKNFVVTDTQHGRHSVNIMTSGGRLIYQFEGGGKHAEVFHWPRYVTCDSRDRIIVSDGANHCLKVFDSCGQFLFKIGSHGDADGHLRHPKGVCVDSNDNILVADHDNNRISFFTREGIFVRHLLETSKPWGLSICRSGLLAVSSKSSISLYHIFESLF